MSINFIAHQRRARLSGKRIDVVYTGMRPGEKMHQDSPTGSPSSDRCTR